MMILNTVRHTSKHGAKNIVPVMTMNMTGMHATCSVATVMQHHLMTGIIMIRVIGGDLLENGRQREVYTIPTRGYGKILPLPMIKYFTRVFLDHARQRPSDTFQVTLVGCDNRRYKPPHIAPFFNYAPENVILPYEFIY